MIRPAQKPPSEGAVACGDSLAILRSIEGESVHLIASDIPYGIGADDWDVLHDNTNSAFLGSSPAQQRAGAVFRKRGKPLNGWSEADREIPRQYYAWCAAFAAEWLRVLRPGGSAMVFAGRRLAHRCVAAFEDAGFTYKDTIAWLREKAPHRAQRLSVVYERRGDTESAARWAGWRIGNLRPTFEPIHWFVKPYRIGGTIADNVLDHGVGAFHEAAYTKYTNQPDNVISVRSGPEDSGLHPTQKPVALMKALIELTTLPGQLVLDPYCGSGTTLVAAAALGRRYLGIDIDEGYCRVARDRLKSEAARGASSRFASVEERKATGATYTPPSLASYVAEKLVLSAPHLLSRPHLRVLDPALGDGALVSALLTALEQRTSAALSVLAYETDEAVAGQAQEELRRRFPRVAIDVVVRDFLTHESSTAEEADLIIANPPYVRTQILGADEARALAGRFGLEGRVDLYQAFLLALIAALRQDGVLAAIVSNRFMTTLGAGALRAALTSRLHIHHVWDLGDTKLFDAAVLPAVIVGQRVSSASGRATAPRFTSVYQSKASEGGRAVSSILDALDEEGVFSAPDGRTFELRQGTLETSGADIWRLSRPDLEKWLGTVAAHTWRTLGALGKIRVGVKTTADRVFIREDWSVAEDGEPELLRPLVTHEIARRYRAATPTKRILYPHLVVDGVRTVADLCHHPRAARYLERHRAALEARTYLIDAGREWYELWVPQDPALWDRPKLVFRDIAERATFWLDRSGAVVNGDCYWMACRDPGDDPLLWLAVAISNTRFIEELYDARFNNKLYAGRRRFMTQYVEQFPLPDPSSPVARELVKLAREIYEEGEQEPSRRIEDEIDRLTRDAFGVGGIVR